MSEQQFVIGRRLKTWYRSTGPDGRVWCESSDPTDFFPEEGGATAPEEWQPLTFERVDYYEAHTGWQPWEVS